MVNTRELLIAITISMSLMASALAQQCNPSPLGPTNCEAAQAAVEEINAQLQLPREFYGVRISTHRSGGTIEIRTTLSQQMYNAMADDLKNNNPMVTQSQETIAALVTNLAGQNLKQTRAVVCSSLNDKAMELEKAGVTMKASVYLPNGKMASEINLLPCQ